MKTTKKIVSILLTLGMVLSMVILPVGAEEGYQVSVDNAVGCIGKEVKLNLNLSGNTDGIASLTVYVFYDTRVLEGVDDEGAGYLNNNGEDNIWAIYEAACSRGQKPQILSNAKASIISEDPHYGDANWAKYSFAFTTAATASPMTDNGVIGCLTFNVKSGIEPCETPLEVLVAAPTDGSGSPIEISGVNGTLTLVNSGVFLDETEITVDGFTDRTLALTAIDSNGSDVTSSTTWNITTPDNEPTWKKSVKVDGGAVIVKKNATAGAYTIEAASGSFFDDAKSVTLTVSRNPSEITYVSASTASDLVVIPIPTAVEGSVSVQQEAWVLDQYRDTLDDKTVKWSMPSSGSGGGGAAVGVGVSVGMIGVGMAPPAPVSVTEDGLLTVTNNAEAGKVTLSIASADAPSVNNTYEVELTKEPAVATSLVLHGGDDEINVPTAPPGEVIKTGTTPFVATVFDQYGKVMPDAEITWSVSSSEVSIENGVVTVSNASFKDTASTEQGSSNIVTVTASCAGLSKSAELTVKREKLEAAVVTASGDTALKAPVKAAETVKKQYSAMVYDQYGFAMTDGVTWETDYYGTSIDASGKLTVTNKAAKGTAEIIASAANGVFSVLTVEIDKNPMIVRAVDATGRVGKTVTVDLKIEDSTDLSALTVYVYYPTDVLTAKSVSCFDVSTGENKSIWAEFADMPSVRYSNCNADANPAAIISEMDPHYGESGWGKASFVYVTDFEGGMTTPSGAIGSITFDISESALDGLTVRSIEREIEVVIVKATNSGNQTIYASGENGTIELRSFTPGDIDDDRRITATDALYALQIAVDKGTWEDWQKLAANVDGDARITATDALWILQAAVDKRTLE